MALQGGDFEEFNSLAQLARTRVSSQFFDSDRES
jgi:hypothetical protein